MDETQRETARKHRVLVVDDDPQTAQLVRDWLDGDRFVVLDAIDGATGLAAARGQDPDLILLDLKMPGMDGLQVARALRGDPRTVNTPVILLTASKNVEHKVEAFNAGADDYVTKPFVVAEIEARINAMLRRRERLVRLESTVDHLESSNRQMETLLLIDEKTGLYNFRAFQRRLAEEWERSKRYKTPLSLVFLDLDHFKQVNDRLGHQAGDRVLQEFALLVTGGARANDVAARYGGEEFAIILPHTEASMAVRVAERIRRAVREFVFFEDTMPTRVTVSAGVATYPDGPDLDTVDALLRSADMALYAAKDAGRDTVVLHGDEPATAR